MTKCLKPFQGQFPCGQCMPCRIARTSEWVTRMLDESEGKDSCFITLTYGEGNLPENGTLVKRDLQLFIKRLRKFVEPVKIKYFACGEYGSKNDRPHYHLIVVGWKPDPLRCSRPDRKNLSSVDIQDLWPFGINVVGSVTSDSIQYVVGYVRKKIIGVGQKAEYSDRLPPFQLQSQGIGKEVIEKKKLSSLM